MAASKFRADPWWLIQHYSRRQRSIQSYFHFREAVAVLFMVLEHFRHPDAKPVYERFRKRGRLAPEGLQYVSSWVTSDLTRCYQVMECDDRALLDQWLAAWQDVVDFEVFSVITSAEAAARVPAESASAI